MKVIIFQTGEEVTSIEEDGRYEYILDSAIFTLKEISGIVTHSKTSQIREHGFVEPGSYVGLLKLELCSKTNGLKIDEAYLEVRSRKLQFETEYRAMLEDIAEYCADFLLQLEAPVEQFLKPEDDVHEATLAQRLYFLKSLLDGEEFRQAVQRIVMMPNTCWHEEISTSHVCKSRRMGRFEIQQLFAGQHRIEVPHEHPLFEIIPTIPKSIAVRDRCDTVDTPENRFVKHALVVFLQALECLLAQLTQAGDDRYPGLVAETRQLINELEEMLLHGFFREVARPDILPLNSPVLQRKEGYRQILRAWLLFELAAKLSWTGGDDVYAGGKRDAAALYEYWVFFRLLDLVAKVFKLKKPPIDQLISKEGLVLNLKAGNQLIISDVFTGEGRMLCLAFNYNRTFEVRDYPQTGSWSRKMRPDYTLSLWPTGFSYDEAEEQELITHVHFDSKYKVSRLKEIFGSYEDDLSEEKTEQRKGTYKRGDLLKMHAYRDAIRRSAGAYVIYPGGDSPTSFRSFHELLPGLGAFPLRPGVSDDGSAALAEFLKEVAIHVCDRATKREQQTYHIYRIYKGEPSLAVHDTLPEKENQKRVKPPAEVFVLHGWCNGSAHLKWVITTGLYNFRTGSNRGSLRLHETVVGASYLLLHGEGDYKKADRLFRIISDGPRVMAREALMAKKYPGKGSEPYYLVFDVRPLEPDDPLKRYVWDLSKLEDVGFGRASAMPQKGISLSRLMKVARLKSVKSQS